jgi:hypothetical protein
MCAPDVQHRGYEGTRKCHRLYCTYVHYSSKIFFVQHKVRRLLELQPCWLLLPSLPLQGMEAGEAGSVRAPAMGHLVRSGACLAPHRPRRATLVPTVRQQGVAGEAASSGAARWPWARLRQRVCVLALTPWPVCQQGTLRLLAAITHGPGEPDDPAPSATLCRATAHHPRACLPSHLRVGRSLRPRSLWKGLWLGWCTAVRPRGATVACAHGQPGRLRTLRQVAHGPSYACGLQVDTEANML